jgi:transposase-like protein
LEEKVFMNKTEQEEHRREMFSLIRDYQDSNMSARAFYRQHNVPEHIFYYWRRKYKEAHGSTEKGFLSVEIGPPVLPPVSEPSDHVQIEYPNGVRITLDKSVSISRLKALIKAI